MPFGQIEALEHDGVQLAFERIEGTAPTFVWLGGFKSDMSGTKAQTLADWTRERGQGFVRFDYSGHGQSGGRFEDGKISRWLGDTLAVLDLPQVRWCWSVRRWAGGSPCSRRAPGTSASRGSC
jgi:alpha-beta hydrolase superfamily lysophospholipase